MFVPVLVWSRIYSGWCTGTQVTNVSPSGLTLGGILRGYSDCTLGGIKASKVLMLRSWTSDWDAIWSTPDASPPCLGGKTRRDEYGACIGKGQTKSDQERKALVLSLSTPPSTAEKDASVRKKALLTSFLSYRWELTIPASLL